MDETGMKTGTRRVVCAVCATPYDDEPDAKRIRRCPQCGSRLIRESDGHLGALETAPPPPKEALKARTPVARPTAPPVLMILGGVLLLIAVGLAVSMFDDVMPLLTGTGRPTSGAGRNAVLFLVTAGGGVICLWQATKMLPSAVPRTGQPCIACAYILPPRHIGRCPECGRLQDPEHPRNWVCPGCRRSLRGFYGNNCPECGADVRTVTDGTPPDLPLV